MSQSFIGDILDQIRYIHNTLFTGNSTLDFTQRFGVGDVSTFDTAYARPVAGLYSQMWSVWRSGPDTT